MVPATAVPIDDPQVAELYRRLAGLTGSLVVELNRAVALAKADDAAAALRVVDGLDLDSYLYLHSTRGWLLRQLGRDAEARAAYRRALELATSTPERRFLARQLEEIRPRLSPGRPLVRGLDEDHCERRKRVNERTDGDLQGQGRTHRRRAGGR